MRSTKPLTHARGSAAAHEQARRVMAEYAAAAGAVSGVAGRYHHWAAIFERRQP